ncbi:hypothetical protein U1Q18_016744 [Sarracenia purpurea var. burkii]
MGPDKKRVRVKDQNKCCFVHWWRGKLALSVLVMPPLPVGPSPKIDGGVPVVPVVGVDGVVLEDGVVVDGVVVDGVVLEDGVVVDGVVLEDGVVVDGVVVDGVVLEDGVVAVPAVLKHRHI